MKLTAKSFLKSLVFGPSNVFLIQKCLFQVSVENQLKYMPEEEHAIGFRSSSSDEEEMRILLFQIFL